MIFTTRFVNTLTQEPVTMRIPADRRNQGAAESSAPKPRRRVLAADTTETVFEPSAEAVLGYLLPHYLNIYLYHVLLNAKASEQSARMVAMKNATDNAESSSRT